MTADAPRTADLSGRTVLNLGCGRKHRPDAVNVDVTARTNPDLVHDLNVRPWPFPSDRFDLILAQDVVEHLDDVVAVMEEMHRVCRAGGVVEIVVPHFSSSNAFTDPSHRRFFSRFSFDYFAEDHALAFYSTARFKVLTANLIFQPTLANKVVHRLANRFPRAYEQRWAWIFPAWFVYAKLQAVKAQAPAVSR